ncbi:MAG: DNA topoisomerase VI subunit B [Planctomycetes bacterium]|nr:DNA topoisomerase VI subunit B [Planctomycetota bacterium]MBI3834321.1 DNA topoisomerase VI subunit B [Planctomycetota bacterium]
MVKKAITEQLTFAEIPSNQRRTKKEEPHKAKRPAATKQLPRSGSVAPQGVKSADGAVAEADSVEGISDSADSKGAPRRRTATAESMAKQQREISVSEFFAKNRHLLGFDNKRKALLTTVKEAVDNSLDACEEAGILPDLEIIVKQTDNERFRVTVRDNGPGIVKQQIPNVFGKLLYGSKFHRLKMSRGQQGIGISAAGMYGLITTGKPIRIVSRTSARAEAHHYSLAIDTKKNRPDIIDEQTAEVDWPHGTEVSIELEASYNKGRQSVDEYLELTAIANPHAKIIYHPPEGSMVEFARGTDKLPPETQEIQPHPYGIELGTLMKMLKETSATKLGAFLSTEFSRVSPSVAKQVCAAAGVTPQSWVNAVEPQTAEKLYQALQAAKLKAPSTDCLAPMGAEAILSGLLKGIKAEFYTASTRPPAVYRGNPFQIEVGVAYGGELGFDRRDEAEDSGASDNGKPNEGGDEPTSRIIRFANRVPLLYQQSSCCLFKSVIDTKWNNYGVSQSSGAMPKAPMVILIHMASVWVPFISEGKEAIADYDDIRKEVKLGIAECGRRLATLLRRKRARADYSRRRDVFTRYIDEVVNSVDALAKVNKESFRKSLVDLAKTFTVQADMEFDEHGKVVKKQTNELGLEDTIVVERDSAAIDATPSALFENVGPDPRPRRRKRT